MPMTFRCATLSAAALLLLATSTSAQPLGTPMNDRDTWPSGTPRSDAAVDLGRHLFFDPRLVLGEDQSCASCHSPHMGYADGIAVSLRAHKDWAPGKRNSPMIYNLTDAPVLHLDGRTPDGQCFEAEDTSETVCLAPLESQAFKSMRSRKVYEGFLPKVQAEPRYRQMFAAAFPPKGAITHVNMARAIAAFERTLVSNQSAFDRYISGDMQALSVEALRGLLLFEGKAGCIACHNGPNLTDWKFHNIGVDSDDPGRSAKVTDKSEKAEMTGAFKTPGLRNVALTAPYMHNGTLGSLEEVVEFYSRGGDKHVNLSPLIQPLELSDREKWDLVAFLNALTHPIDTEPPEIPGL